MRHWHRDPAPSTERLIENAPFTATAKGLQLAIELISYPEGKVQVSVSRISGSPGRRMIVQAESLMFNDINEAKDAIDGLADRLDREAGATVESVQETRSAVEPLETFTIEGLKGAEFEGFLTFGELLDGRLADVPRTPGIYIVVREPASPPSFRDISPGGHFKDRDPTELPDVLEAKWIDDCSVLYIGKGDLLQRRLREYARFGAGHKVGHWGGRYIWQLTDSDELLVAWRPARDGQAAREAEAEFVAAFKERFGRLPFANIADPSS